MSKKLAITAGIVAASALTVAIGYSSVMGYNEATERHVAVTYYGNTKEVNTAGPFYYGNGMYESYKNSLRTVRTPQGRACDYEQQDGFIVQYGDGGKGSICAQLDTPTPTGSSGDKDAEGNDIGMLTKLHLKYYTETGVRNKLLDPEFRSLFTKTAELFTSTEAYETKRSQIAAALQDQLRNGAYVTIVKDREIVVGVNDDGTELTQTKGFSMIKYSSYDKKGNPTGTPLYQPNVFEAWDMTNIQVTVTGYDFEAKTMTQIADRRDAANRGQTAQANAKAAYWEGEQAKADGETKRIKAQAAAEIQNAPKIADANRDAALAIIEATKQKDKAKELEKAAIARTGQKTQEALAAVQEAKVITTLAKAEAYKLDTMQAAGKLFKEIDAQVAMNADIAQALGVMNVPSTMIIGGNDSKDGSNEMQKLLQLQVLKSVKDMQ